MAESTHTGVLSLPQEAVAGEVNWDVVCSYDDVFKRLARWAAANFRWEGDIEEQDLYSGLQLKCIETLGKYRAYLTSMGVQTQRGYIYSVLRNYIRSASSLQRKRSLSADALALDMARLQSAQVTSPRSYYYLDEKADCLTTDGGLYQQEEFIHWQEYFTTLSVVERAVFWYRFQGYTWEETAAAVTRIQDGVLRGKSDKLRRQEIEDGRYIWKLDIRKLTFTVKQARGAYGRSLVKLERYAVQKQLTAWLAYINGALPPGDSDDADIHGHP